MRWRNPFVEAATALVLKLDCGTGRPTWLIVHSPLLSSSKSPFPFFGHQVEDIEYRNGRV